MISLKFTDLSTTGLHTYAVRHYERVLSLASTELGEVSREGIRPVVWL